MKKHQKEPIFPSPTQAPICNLHTEFSGVLRCSVVSDSLRPQGLQLARLLCPWGFPGKNTGVGCHFLHQGIFLTQRSNPYHLSFPHWQVDSLPLALPGKPNNFLLWASLVAQLVKNPPAMRETWVRSLSQEDPLKEKMATHSSILAWETPWTEEPGRLKHTGSQESDMGTSLAVQWLRLWASTGGGTGSILSWGAKIPHATSHC